MRRPGEEDTLGTYIRKARTRLRLTLRAAASKVGITPSYLSDIELDRRVPAQEVLEGLARLSKLNPDELWSRAGRLDPRTQAYLRRSPGAVRLFRTIATYRLSEAELAELERHALKLGQRKR